MITLFTKDGSRTGNAIIYGGEGGIFFIETDFGNRLKLTADEITERFTLGRVCSYEQWCADRDHLRKMNTAGCDGSECGYPCGTCGASFTNSHDVPDCSGRHECTCTPKKPKGASRAKAKAKGELTPVCESEAREAIGCTCEGDGCSACEAPKA